MSDELEQKARTVALQPGKNSICTCGKSKTLPYCDNSHRKLNEEKGASYKSLKIFNPIKTTINLKVYSSNWDD